MSCALPGVVLPSLFLSGFSEGLCRDESGLTRGRGVDSFVMDDIDTVVGGRLPTWNAGDWYEGSTGDELSTVGRGDIADELAASLASPEGGGVSMSSRLCSWN